MTTIRTTTIERCTGIHDGTGLPVMETYEVRTEHRDEEYAAEEHEREVEIHEAVSDVRAARDLDQLCDALNRLHRACRAADVSAADYIDTSSLPTFGGEEPADTSGVYSWDEARYLHADYAMTTRELEVGPWGIADRAELAA